MKFVFIFLFNADCESLIRKMLVLDPSKRYTIEQIKRHRWMLADSSFELPIANQLITAAASGVGGGVGGTSGCEPNEQILRLMQNLGIDAQKTRDSLRVSFSFNAVHIFDL